MSNLTERIKDNPVMATVSAGIVLATGLTAIVNVGGYWDSRHTTEAELVAMIEKHTADPHPSAQAQIDSNKRLSICSTVSIQITIVEQQIWEMKQHGVSSERLVEKERELSQLEDKYKLYKCAEM